MVRHAVHVSLALFPAEGGECAGYPALIGSSEAPLVDVQRADSDVADGGSGVDEAGQILTHVAGAILAEPNIAVNGTMKAKGPGFGLDWDEHAIARFAVGGVDS